MLLLAKIDADQYRARMYSGFRVNRRSLPNASQNTLFACRDKRTSAPNATQNTPFAPRGFRDILPFIGRAKSEPCARKFDLRARLYRSNTDLVGTHTAFRPSLMFYLDFFTSNRTDAIALTCV